MSTIQQLALALLVFLLATDAGAQGGLGESGNPCQGLPSGSCVRVVDTDGDGRFGEDFYYAFRLLLYPGGVLTTAPVVYLAPPPSVPASGYLLLEQRVRYCLSTSIPTGTAPHSCDAPNDVGLPEIRGVGDWSRFPLATDVEDPSYPNVWTPNPNGPDAALWIGDQYADNSTGLVRVSWPGLRVEQACVNSIAYLGLPPWDAILPLFCDGCTGSIGFVSKMVSLPAGFQALFPLFVGSDLEVTLDVTLPTGGSAYSHGAQMIGDRILVNGYSRRASVAFGQDAEGTSSYLPPSSVRTWGTSGGFAYSGIYAFDAQGDDTSVSATNAIEVDILRAPSGPNIGSKPVLSLVTGGGNPYPRVNIHGAIRSDSTTNGAVRIDAVAAGNVGDPTRPPVLNLFGGLWPNAIHADQGATIICGSQGSAPSGTTGFSPGVPPSPGCIYNRFGARRAPGGKLQVYNPGVGVTRFQPANAAGLIYSPDERRLSATVSLASAADGLCILNPLGAATIGTCDATAEIVAQDELVRSRARVELLADAPAGSSCRVVAQQEIYPGSGTYDDGPIAATECTAANAPHPACTGPGAAVGLRGGATGWMHPHYGEAARPLFAVLTSDAKGEAYQATSAAYMSAGQRYRWIFKRLRYCDAQSGGRTSWECTADADCRPSGFPSGLCTNAANACGNVNAMRLTWAEIPADREPQCYDGVDNDADSLVDWATSGGDTGCADRLDDSE